MKIEKQQIILAILQTGYYEIDTEKALVYSIRKRGKSLLKTNVLPTELKLIRSPEIASIRQLLSCGYSQASIAKQLSLERLSVRYIIKRIEAGLSLKYE